MFSTPKDFSADYFHLPRGLGSYFFLPSIVETTNKSPDSEYLPQYTMADHDRSKHGDVLHVERVQDDVDASKNAAAHKSAEEFQGDVGLTGPGDAIYLIPTPSPDPRGMHAHR